jgi:hypothetical protein
MALPYLDAVVASPSAQPPNLSRIPSITPTPAKGAKGAPVVNRPGATSTTKTAAAAAAPSSGNRKRKALAPPATVAATPNHKKGGPPPGKKRGAKAKLAAHSKTDADVSSEELMSVDAGEEVGEVTKPDDVGEEDEEQDEAHIKEVEARLLPPCGCCCCTPAHC